MARKGTPRQRKQKANPVTAPASARPAFVPSLKINILLLVVVTFAAYVNAVHDNMIWDDRVFLVDTGFQQLSLEDFPDFFTESLWEAAGNTTRLYRPFLLLTLGIQAQAFGDWWTGYHLVTVLTHVLATLLVYGFIREFLFATSAVEDKNSPVILVAAMVFGVHPVLGDAVNSVFNGSEIYASMGVLASLIYLLRSGERPGYVRWFVVSVLFLVSLMYRESAVALPLLAAFTLWVTSKGRWPSRIRECLPVMVLIIPLAVYFGLRDLSIDSNARDRAGGAPVVSVEEMANGLAPEAGPPSNEAAEPATSPLSALGLQVNPETVVGVFPMWLEALGLTVWPHPLVIVRNASTVPVGLAIAVQVMILAAALTLAVRGHPSFLLGLLFFYLAILPSSRIIAEGNQAPLLLERMLYLPLTGLVMALAGGLSYLARKSSRRVSVVTGLVFVLMLMPQSWARNTDWSDEVRLLEIDYAKNGNSIVFVSLLKAQARHGRMNDTIAACEAYEATGVAKDRLDWTCGRFYMQAGKHQRAEPLLLRTTASFPRDAWRRLDLAMLYARTGRRDEARAGFEEARRLERLPFLKEIMSALELIELYPHDRQRMLEARRHLESALEIQPRATQAQELLDRLDKQL